MLACCPLSIGMQILQFLCRDLPLGSTGWIAIVYNEEALSIWQYIHIQVQMKQYLSVIDDQFEMPQKQFSKSILVINLAPDFWILFCTYPFLSNFLKGFNSVIGSSNWKSNVTGYQEYHLKYQMYSSLLELFCLGIYVSNTLTSFADCTTACAAAIIAPSYNTRKSLYSAHRKLGFMV